MNGVHQNIKCWRQLFFVFSFHAAVAQVGVYVSVPKTMPHPVIFYSHFLFVSIPPPQKKTNFVYHPVLFVLFLHFFAFWAFLSSIFSYFLLQMMLAYLLGVYLMSRPSHSL
jgi:hypothetical protein